MTSDPATLAYGTSAKQKLSNPVIARGPEDQLKTPLDGYFAAMAELIGYHSRHAEWRRGVKSGRGSTDKEAPRIRG